MKEIFFGFSILTLPIFATVIATAAENNDSGLDVMLAMMEGTYRSDPAALVGEEMPECVWG